MEKKMNIVELTNSLHDLKIIENYKEAEIAIMIIGKSGVGKSALQIVLSELISH